MLRGHQCAEDAKSFRPCQGRAGTALAVPALSEQHSPSPKDARRIDTQYILLLTAIEALP